MAPTGFDIHLFGRRNARQGVEGIGRLTVLIEHLAHNLRKLSAGHVINTVC
jgi:hypothetical protein